MWCIILIDLWILKKPFILGIKPTWSWCTIYLICCWILFARILLRIFASMFIIDIGFVVFLPVTLPTEIPKFPTDPLVRVFLGIWKLLLLDNSLPGMSLILNSFVSLLVFYILSYLLSKRMGCLSECLVSSASFKHQLLFHNITWHYKKRKIIPSLSPLLDTPHIIILWSQTQIRLFLP